VKDDAEETPAAACRSALIVDDSIFVRLLLRTSLKSCGVLRVIEANDGQEALAYLEITDDIVDVVFCDLDMPTVDGIQFIRSLASFECHPPVVFISSAPERTLRAAETLARSNGIQVAGALHKPFKHENILAILRALPPPKQKSRIRAKIVIAADQLAAGISHGEIDLHYQPKVDLRTRALTGVEALARWNHPIHGLLYPDSFIALAERENLAGPLTEAVLDKAVRQCVIWRDCGLACKVAVNLSPQMITDVALPERLTAIVSQAGISPSDLILEVTESGMFADDLLSMEIVTRLDLRGFAISIDDYGTGYSSMQQLQRMPFAELKIDRMFITGAARSSVNQSVIRSSVELARKLTMSVVAEGVETAEDWSLVYAAECDIAQGYFIARPMPADAVIAWAANWRTRTDVPAAAASAAPGL
jgi:EAL domain-containing protein (putative c-di-GMP-specific phosphodiesterase class I)